MTSLRIPLATAGVAALLLLAATAPLSDAQVVVHNRGINPWTGMPYHNVVAYNPWSGRVVRGARHIDPWTGATVHTARVRNPWTGRRVNVQAVRDPWTGDVHIGVSGRRRRW
jgi:hypothetical protein